MKKTLLLLALAFVTTTAFAQKTEKYVLVETFTNTCCGPCAYHNPIFQQNVLDVPELEEKVHHITYHPWWPCTSDPMYQHNVQENTGRTNFYSVSGVPTSRVQGTYATTAPGNIDASMINSAYASMADLSIDVDFTKDATTGYATVTVKTVGDQPTSTTLRLRNVVVERQLDYTSPPGSNGERDFPNVMRRFLSNYTSIPDYIGDKITPSPSGESVTFDYTFPLDSEWDADNIYVISFVQASDKSVLQSGSSDDNKTSGISDAKKARFTDFYPNPANNATSIRVHNAPANATFELINVLGAVSTTTVVSSNGVINIDTKDLSDGIYFGRVISDNGIVSTSPLVVTH